MKEIEQKVIQEEAPEEGLSFYLSAKLRHGKNMRAIRLKARREFNLQTKQKVKEAKSLQSDIEILEYLAEGKTAKQISKLIFISDRTIEGRLLNMRIIFHCKNNAHLVATAIRKKIID